MRAALTIAAVMIAATSLAAAVAGPSPAVPADRSSQTAPEVKVAVLTGSRCGKFADDTTAAIRVADLEPGQASSPLTLCVANAGRSSGRLLVASTTLVEIDIACTGDEALVDTTCGGDGNGELAADLVHDLRVAVPCAPSRPTVGAEYSVGFAALAEGVALGTLARDQLACVSVTLRRTATHGGPGAAQSDRVIWRYRFVLAED